jgi:3-phytase
VPNKETSRRRAAAALLAGAVVTTPAAVPVASAASAEVRQTIAVAADSYVSSARSDTNYGTSAGLWVDGSPTMRTYMRFDIPATAALVKGELHVHVTRSAEAFEVRRVSDTTWKESTLTFANAPAVGTVRVNSGPVTKGGWAKVDVTSLLPSSGVVSLALTPLSSTSQSVSSREAGRSVAPRLVVQHASTAVDATSPSVSLTSPTSGTVYTAPGTVDVTTSVSDDAGVAKVEFFDNGTHVGTEDTAPFALTWSVSSSLNGPHRWTARAYDAAGNAITSPPVDVTVDVPVTDTPSGTGGAATASVETVAVPSSGDAADDVAVWMHPTDPSLSTVIGTDKLGGLAVYDLSGKQLAYYADSKPNNVDIRYNFPLGGQRVALVVTSDRTTDALRAYKVDPTTRRLEHVSARRMSVGIGLYGLCMYRSPSTGKYYAFDSDSSGTLQQWELFDDAGKVDARKVRQIAVGTTTEGCVADDETGALYIAEEDVAIWRYDGEPSTGTTRTKVDGVGAGRLVADVEGLSIYYGGGGSGYLVASSQGSNSFVVYDRRPPHAAVKTFTVDAGTVDAVSYTDGLDVLSTPLGAAFPEGVFIAQDDRNDSGNQNYKLVPWGRVARAGTTSLTVDTGWDPRQVGARTPDPTASPTPTSSPPPGARGTIYYVDSRKGSDANPGTSPQVPWRTLAKANSVVLAPGSSVLLARGSSFRGPLRPSGSGASDDPAVLAAYGTGPAPVVRDSSTCVGVSGSHVVVRDLEVRSCTWAGIEVSGSANTIERNLVSDTAAGVYLKPGARSNRVLRNRLIDNNRMSVLTSTSSSDDSGAFGVLLRGDSNEIAHNTISGSDAFSYDYGRDGAAIEIYGGVDNHIHHNTAVDNDAFSELGHSRSSGNVFAYNEVRSSLDTSVFLVTRGAKSSYGPVMRTKVYNNSVLLTGASSQGFVCHAGCGPDILTMRNNIVQAVAKVGYADAPLDEDNGVYWGGKRQFVLGPRSLVAAPRFVDGTAGNLRLQPSSPAVERGARLPYDRDLDGLPTPVDGNGDGVAMTDAGAYERRW